MAKLLMLIAVTFAALYAVMSVYGAGNPRAQNRPATVNSVQTAAQDAGADEARKAPDPAASAELIEAAVQTPEKVQEFPGPALRPSPEHAGETPAAEALTDATGPILYVTGSRVNFRAGPSTNDRVMGALNGGDAVEAVGPTDGPWINIRTADGRLGYMSGQFLASTPD